MDSEEVASVLLLAGAIYLFLVAWGAILGMAQAMANLPWQQHLVLREAFMDLRNNSIILLWVGAIVGIIGLMCAGGEEGHNISNDFYWFFFLVALVGTITAFII